MRSAVLCVVRLGLAFRGWCFWLKAGGLRRTQRVRAKQGPVEYVKRLEGRFAFAKQSPYYCECYTPVHSPTKAVDL